MDELQPAKYKDIQHVCFTDYPRPVEGWDVREVYKTSPSKVESAKYLALSHLYFPEAAYTIYHGGAGQLLKHPEEIIEDLGGMAMLATFKHPTRDCIYQEAEAVIKYRKQGCRPTTVLQQTEYYRGQGFPKHYGLVMTALFIRKHAGETICFNEALWALMSRFTPRDQLAIDFLRWKQNLFWKYLPGGENTMDRMGPNDYITYRRNV